MEVIAVANSEHRWRWQIRHNDKTVTESDAEFSTVDEAIVDGVRRILELWTGQDRPQIGRRSQRPKPWSTRPDSGEIA